jgi:hypothetical protein
VGKDGEEISVGSSGGYLMKYFVCCVGLLLLVPTVLTIVHSNKEMNTQKAIAGLHNIDSRKSYAANKILDTLTFGVFKGAEEKDARIQSLQEIATDNHSKVVVYAWSAGLLGGLLLGLTNVQGKKNKEHGGIADKALLWVTSLALLVGLLAPIFTFSKSASYPVLGEVVHYSEVLTIPSAAAKVWATNPVIACVIILFSVVTPLAKIGLSLYLSFGGHFKVKTRKILLFLSKWSMADVFIVAVFLAVLSSSKGDGQFAAVGVGFYFFLVYCLLAHLQMFLHLRMGTDVAKALTD